jgi:hypothetical protein
VLKKQKKTGSIISIEPEKKEIREKVLLLMHSTCQLGEK